LQDIKDQSARIKHIFDTVFSLFEEIYDDFRVSFHSYNKDIDWDDWIEN